jgi:hypothetical protein
MKILFPILILFALNSCQVQESDSIPISEEKEDNCAYHFNSLFMEIFEGDLSYKIKEARIVTPEFIPEFYSKNEIETFCYFELKNDSSEFLVAIDTVNTNNHHKMYFCFDFKEHKFIDQSSSVIGDLYFISNCGIDLNKKSELSQNGWTTNIWDHRMMGLWLNETSNEKSKYSNIEFTKKLIIINQVDTIPYYQTAFEFFHKTDSTLIFERQALSDSKLILKKILDTTETYYYLNKK